MVDAEDQSSTIPPQIQKKRGELKAPPFYSLLSVKVSERAARPALQRRS
jgi:hypothetical protein